MRLKDVWSIARQAVSDWSSDQASSMGEALAYYTIFSMAPLLVLVIAIAGLVFGRAAAEGQVVTQIQDAMDPRAPRRSRT